MRRVGGCASHEFEGPAILLFPKPLPPQGPKSPTPRSTFCVDSPEPFPGKLSFKHLRASSVALLGTSTAVRLQRARRCTDSAHPYRARRLTPRSRSFQLLPSNQRHSPVTFAPRNHNIVIRGSPAFDQLELAFTSARDCIYVRTSPWCAHFQRGRIRWSNPQIVRNVSLIAWNAHWLVP
jgi:hypothetical protein